MTEQETSTTLSRVQHQIDLITNAPTEEHARIARYMASGYVLALFFEGLIDRAEHALLEEAAARARAHWLPPAERESVD